MGKKGTTFHHARVAISVVIVVEIILLLLFVQYFERVTAYQFQERQDYYGSMLTRSIWDFDYPQLLSLVEIIVANQEFASFEIKLAGTEQVIRSESSELNRGETWLRSIHLIRKVEQTGEIYFQDTLIATVVSSWYNRNAQIYFPIILSLFLFDLFLYYFLVVLKNRAVLKKEVEMRTTAQRQLAALNDELEELVRTRTLQLEHTNIDLTQEIRERKEIALQLERAKLETDALNEQLMAQNQELEAMNRELEEAYVKQTDLSEKLENLISMSFDLSDTGDENMESLFSKILNIAMSLIQESDCGSISIVEGDQWRFIDAAGHDIQKLKEIPLIKEYLIGSSEKTRQVDDILSKNIIMPEEISNRLIDATLPIKDSILSYLTIDGEVVGSLALDISKSNQSHFSEDSIRVLRSLGNMASAFLAMRKVIQTDKELRKAKKDLELANRKLSDQNERLEQMVGQVQHLAEGLEEIVRVSNRISEAVLRRPDEFLRDILELLVGLVEHADYGSVSVFEGDERRFVHVIGHDSKLLCGYRMKVHEMDEIKELTVIEEIVSKNLPFMSSETKRRMEEASMPVKSSIIVPLGIKDESFGTITLDIAQESIHEFSQNDKRMVQAFSNIASAFLGLQRFMIQQGRIQKDLLLSMIQILEIYDMYTKGHSENVAFFSSLLAQKMKKSSSWTKKVYWAGLVHDIGKLLIPTQVLNKPSKLSDDEYELVKMHPIWGEKVLQTSEHLKEISAFVLHHHERWDGKGYPDGLAGEAIPLASRIISLADTFDAMTSERSYRKPLPFERVREELIRNSGTQFDPDVVDAFLAFDEKDWVRKERSLAPVELEDVQGDLDLFFKE